jgi:hypothetical protein
MFGMLLLSADSAFLGAAIRFFPETKKYVGFACMTLGLADAMALLLGFTLRRTILDHITPSSQHWVLIGCALTAIALGKAARLHPRAAIVGIALLLSVDNFFAGGQLSPFAPIGSAACVVGILSFLSTFAGSRCADAIAGLLKPSTAFALARCSLAIRLLHL